MEFLAIVKVAVGIVGGLFTVMALVCLYGFITRGTEAVMEENHTLKFSDWKPYFILSSVVSIAMWTLFYLIP